MQALPASMYTHRDGELNLASRLELVWSLHKKMKFPIKGFFSKYDQIRSFLRIRSHFLKKSLMDNFIFCAVGVPLRYS